MFCKAISAKLKTKLGEIVLQSRPIYLLTQMRSNERLELNNGKPRIKHSEKYPLMPTK